MLLAAPACCREDHRGAGGGPVVVERGVTCCCAAGEEEQGGRGGRRKKKKAKRKKRAKRLPGEEVDRSDSEEEEERIAKFWEGKHRPCVRKAWVVAKWTMTKKEAKRQEQEEAEIYDLVVRLREMIDEHLHTPEGRERLNTEVERRVEIAKTMVEVAEKEVCSVCTLGVGGRCGCRCHACLCVCARGTAR